MKLVFDYPSQIQFMLLHNKETSFIFIILSDYNKLLMLMLIIIFDYKTMIEGLCT